GQLRVGVDIHLLDREPVAPLIVLEQVERLVAATALLARVDRHPKVRGIDLRTRPDPSGQEGNHRGGRSLGCSSRRLHDSTKGRTSTRLSKKVAPPPMSVRAVEVVRLTPPPPGLSLLQ